MVQFHSHSIVQSINHLRIWCRMDAYYFEWCVYLCSTKCLKSFIEGLSSLLLRFSEKIDNRFYVRFLKRILYNKTTDKIKRLSIAKNINPTRGIIKPTAFVIFMIFTHLNALWHNSLRAAQYHHFYIYC